MNNPEIGKIIEFSREFSEADVSAFSSLSGDDNPIHLDKEYAARTPFKQRVVPGILTASMFSKIFGNIFPGNGSIYLKQSLKFIKPVFIDQRITARVILTAFQEDKQRGTFATECFNEEGILVITGEAVVVFNNY